MFGGRHNRFLLIAIAFLVTVYYYSSKVNQSGLSLWTGRAHFKWRDLALRYPPETITPLSTGPPGRLASIQYKFKSEDEDDANKCKGRQVAVKEAFLRSWASYKKYAWKADELQPISGEPKNNYAGWGASLVDNLDTLWIMGLQDEFKHAVDAALEIRFDKSTLEQVNVFETTIRYLGGFLAAYDLSTDTRLLDKAVDLGDMLLHAFDTPNHLPITRWHMQDSRKGYAQNADETVLVAEIGSLSMEFTRLTQLTGDSRYYSAIAHVTNTFAAQQNHTLLPGLWPVVVNARTGNFTEGNSFTLGGMADSVYEYLPKMHALLGGREPLYADMYRTFAATALAHNIRRPMLPDDADVLVSIDIIARPDSAGSSSPSSSSSGAAPGTSLFLNEQAQHLVCFAGGMFASAGKLLSLPQHVDVGRKLTDGCVWAYQNMPTGIMPEIFSMSTCPAHLDPAAADRAGSEAAADQCRWNETRWREDVMRERRSGEGVDRADRYIAEERLPRGFTAIADRRYLLRPEAIESVFVLYRITGEEKYREYAWQMFEAVLKASWTKLANGMVADVSVAPEEVRVGDTMESFWMAETLKYFYLIFSEPDLISLDEYVFNTEAHPFKRLGAAEDVD